MEWEDIISSISSYLDMYTLGESWYLVSKYVLSPGFPAYLFLTLGPFHSLPPLPGSSVPAEPWQNISNADGKHYKESLESLVTDYWEPIFSVFFHVCSLYSQDDNILCIWIAEKLKMKFKIYVYKAYAVLVQ